MASARTVAGGRLVNLGTALTVPVTNSSISTRLVVGSQMAQVSAGKVGVEHPDRADPAGADRASSPA